MSDNRIALIPEDPRYVPSASHQSRAIERFRELAPDADQIEIKLNETVQFFDCGANFESIICPSCRCEVPTDWWQDRMEDDFKDEGFKLAKYSTPCCHAEHSLQELIYEWPQGFGRFAIDAMNPKIGKLQDQHVAEFEQILGTRLRVIYQHI